jgi:hypothetical protein
MNTAIEVATTVFWAGAGTFAGLAALGLLLVVVSVSWQVIVGFVKEIINQLNKP